MIDQVLKKQGKTMDDLYVTEWDKTLEKFYMKLFKHICDGKNKMLQPIHLDIKEKQQFYSKSDKKMLDLGPTWKMYLVSETKDDKDRVLVYAPYLFQQGQLFLIPEELIIRIGYN